MLALVPDLAARLLEDRRQDLRRAALASKRAQRMFPVRDRLRSGSGRKNARFCVIEQRLRVKPEPVDLTSDEGEPLDRDVLSMHLDLLLEIGQHGRLDEEGDVQVGLLDEQADGGGDHRSDVPL